MNASEQAQEEQTDAMTLWVAERTLRRYGRLVLAHQINDIANEMAMGKLSCDYSD